MSGIGKVLTLLDRIGEKYPEHMWTVDYHSGDNRSIAIWCYPDEKNNRKNNMYTHQILVKRIQDFRREDEFEKQVDDMLAMLYDIKANGLEVVDNYGAKHTHWEDKGEE